MLDNAQQIEAGFHPGSASLSTRLKVGCSTTIGNYVLPLVLRELHTTAAHLRVEMEAGNSTAIAAKVANFELEMGLIEGPCHVPELHVEPWLSDELLIVVGSQHPLAKQANVTRKDLRAAAWLLREPGSGTREEVEQRLLRHLHQLADARQIGSSEAIKHMVMHGLGVSCLVALGGGGVLGCRDVEGHHRRAPADVTSLLSDHASRQVSLAESCAFSQQLPAVCTDAESACYTITCCCSAACRMFAAHCICHRRGVVVLGRDVCPRCEERS
ncbi:LysR substrate-binding domain-containing protein [Xanthomonas campestris pv. campestris]|nr:LysR substrate-binding domain-containing protein [Xanthomonas campestris pv. campestris]